MAYTIGNTARKFKPEFHDEDVFYPETDGQPMAETDKHRKLLVDLTETLDLYFKDNPTVYVTGNIMFYYIEGEPEECISPDVMICFGVPKGERRTYKVWTENDVVPSVVIELASRSTFKRDRTEKRELYQMLGVKEYFIYNPEYPKTLPSLLAFRLAGKRLEPVEFEDGRVFSRILDLELIDTGDTLRLFNPKTKNFLPNFAEMDEKLKSANEARQVAEAEIERLRAELAKLKS